MQVFVNYPETEEGINKLINNLATFKAELFLKSIDNLNIEDKVKDEVLEKVLEILSEKPDGSII